MRLSQLALAAMLCIGSVAVADAGNIAPSTSNPRQKFEERNGKLRPVDCHRDVRIHRIGGVKVRHRHVGDDCRIRQVRQVN